MTKDATSQLSSALEQSIKELNDLFQKENLTESFRQNLLSLNEYYTRRFWNFDSFTKRQTLVNVYCLLLATIKQIKAGSLPAEQAINNLDSITSDRKTDVVVRNIFKACELLFWLPAALTSYAFCIGFGVPLMFFNLPLGLAITGGTSVLMLEAAVQALKCVDDFQSFSSINKQERLERNVVSFFLPPKKNKKPMQGEEELDASLSSDISPSPCC
jgi:hypothetical protein